MKTFSAGPVLVASFLAFSCSNGGGAGRDNDGSSDASPADDASADAGTPDLSVDPLSVVSGSAHEHEPFIAVTPSGRVAVSFTSFSANGTKITVGYRISNDRGTTWGPTTLVPIPSGANEQANASVAAGDDGTLYMAWGSEEHTETGRSNQHRETTQCAFEDMDGGVALPCNDLSTFVPLWCGT